MTKKIVSKASKLPLAAAALGVAAVVGISGCSVADSEEAENGKPIVATTFTVLQDMAENVAGEHLNVVSITKPGAEIHGYSPTTGDIRRVSDASLVLDNGMGLEAWFEKFIDKTGVKHVVVSDGIDPIDITSGEYSGRPNPHAWMSPVQAHIYVDNMAEAFAELDPEHEEDYKRNAKEYGDTLDKLQSTVVAAVKSLPAEQRVLVSCEGAFSYLARDSGMAEAFLWPINAEQQGTPQQVASVITTVRDSNVPAVFCESTVSDASMQQVVSETDATFGGKLYVDSLSGPDGPVPTYVELLEYDLDMIVKGLTS